MFGLNSWTGSLIGLLTLATVAQAEVSVSKANDPTMPLDAGMIALLGQDHAALGAVSGARLVAIVAEPSRKKSRKAPGVEVYDETWLAAQPAATGDAQFECLTKALYFEARGETLKGQAAVGEVILNRVDRPGYPRTICGVVEQSNAGGCQFSYVCDSRSDAMHERLALARAAKIARALIDGAERNLTNGATHFHTANVNPGWADDFTLTTRIGTHVFYRQPRLEAAG